MKTNQVFDYEKFADFLEKEVVKNSEQKRGFKKDLAEFLNLHPTTLSQIFNGTRVFTDEQVHLLGEFLGLSEIENEFVSLLHQISNTQNKKYRDVLIKRKDAIKNRSLNLNERIEKDRLLTDEEKSVFYSSWQYTAVWVYVSLEGGKTKDEIAERLGVDKKQVGEILEFLLKTALCSFENGRYKYRVGRIHLDKSSPHLKQHHSNWRIKSIQSLDHAEDKDLTFTAPLSLSRKDFDKLREELVQYIKSASETVKDTNPEEIYCLNLDFFKI